MRSQVAARIDRQVKVIDGLGKNSRDFSRISDLRELPFVVLLGEPGIGKSTVLAAEAAHENAFVITVRELMTGTEPAPSQALFLDALDEYRTDGGAEDKVHTLANAILKYKPTRWRLTCRSEDWRKAADMAPISKTTAGGAIAVVQLLPLNFDEAASILNSLGESDPDRFLRSAESYGAAGFIESPLGLKLLHSAVADGSAWPVNRFQLFTAATRRLAFERSAVRSVTDRHSVDSILDAAGEAFLLLLTSGARAIWRSNNEPPSAQDARAYVTAHDLDINRDLLKHMLDTPLFRGEGEAFEPMHRTIGEFLAARALSKVVRGSRERAALPLSRALALITGSDRSPPTELRGLFAWLAAHLAYDGNNEAALRMIEQDAVSVLSYGDAAVFETPGRRAILQNLGRADPYFRATEVGVTSVGGLAGEDLADDFASVLTDQNDESHRRYSVFEALTIGKPVLSLRPLLRSIILDANCPEWQRKRALEALLNGVEHPSVMCRQLFDLLSLEATSAAREALRAELASHFAPAVLTVADVRSILADYRRSAPDNMMGRLYGLLKHVESEPMPELFDEPIASWLPATRDGDRDRDHRIEIGHLLDYALASAIRTTPALPASRLWRWLSNIRRDPWSSLKDQTKKAVTDWLNEDGAREVALFRAALTDDSVEDGPWVVPNKYIMVSSKQPSDGVLEHLLRSVNATSTSERERLLAITVEIALIGKNPGQYWPTYDQVVSRGDDELLNRLTISTIADWRRDQGLGRAEARDELERQRVTDVADLQPLLADIRAGRRAYSLGWAAEIYFERDGLPDIERVAARSDAVTANAILDGWNCVVAEGLGEVDAAALGTAEAEQRRYYIEAAAAAGVYNQLKIGDTSSLPDTPIDVALAVLKSSWIANGQDRHDELDAWAINRLNAEPTAGAARLLRYWTAALDAGAVDLPGIWRLQDAKPSAAFEIAIEAVLRDRPNIVAVALRSALRASAKVLSKTQLIELSTAALCNPVVVGAEREVWTLIAFILDPVANAGSLVDERGGENVGAFLDGSNSELIGAMSGLGGVDRLPTRALTVRLLGRTVAPEDEQSRSGRVTDRHRSNETVRNCINSIATDPRAEAASTLSNLLADPALSSWANSIRHAQAQQRRIMRDQTFKHPSASVVRAALDCGPPVNALDLRAVVISELQQLRAELRNTDTSPWKRYWNNSRGTVSTPLIENECRDYLLDRLRDRLAKYQIAAALPEARRGSETRADALILTGAGRNLPIEVKRHFHPAIWTAASTQLVGYAADPGADCMGVYLVFWFGNEVSPTPARPDGGVGPTTGAEMEAMLLEGLPYDVRPLIDVIVFDISNPTAFGGKPRRKSRKKTSV
jgi:hypothetical protein